MKEIKKLLNAMDYFRVQTEKHCISLLGHELRIAKGKRIEFTDENGNAYGDEFVSVVYDGGNHPEYASNAFSTVNAIYMKRGQIYLDIEDDDEYPLANVSLDELINITIYVYKNVLGNIYEDEKIVVLYEIDEDDNTKSSIFAMTESDWRKRDVRVIERTLREYFDERFKGCDDEYFCYDEEVKKVALALHDGEVASLGGINSLCWEKVLLVKNNH